MKCTDPENTNAIRTATDDGDYRCRIWAINDITVHRALMTATLCTDEKLAYNIANDIKRLFPGISGSPQAMCCTWSKCNFNTTLAVMADKPAGFDSGSGSNNQNSGSNGQQNNNSGSNSNGQNSGSGSNPDAGLPKEEHFEGLGNYMGQIKPTDKSNSMKLSFCKMFLLLTLMLLS